MTKPGTDRARSPEPASKAGRGADPAPTKLTTRQKVLREVRGYAEALAIAFLVVTFIFTTVGVVGSSMDPNLDGGDGRGNLLRALLTGDRVFIPKYDTWLRRMGVLGDFERGAVVVLREPANAPTALETGRRKFFIKRVIAGPGDLIRIERGQVFVNGHPIDQGFITDSGRVRVAQVDFPKVVVENGEVSAMVMGFETSRSGNSLPMLPTGNFSPSPVSVADPRVQLFYGNVLSAIVVPDDLENSGPIVLDTRVPEGYYFVMGDNRSSGGSEDSRYFGPVRAMDVAGRATAVIWPPRRDGEWNWRTLPAPNAFAAIPAAGASTSGP